MTMLAPCSTAARGELRVLPVLHDRPLRQARARDLLPADHPLAVAHDDRGDALDESDVVRGRRRGRLVAADVEERPGRQRRDFAHDVLDELVGPLVRHVERAEADVGARVRLRRVARGRELRIRDERRVHVTGQIDLGNDDDVALRGERDELRVLVLRVPAARARRRPPSIRRPPRAAATT